MTKTTREQFEYWASTPPRKWDLRRFAINTHSSNKGDYIHFHVQYSWEAFKENLSKKG